MQTFWVLVALTFVEFRSVVSCPTVGDVLVSPSLLWTSSAPRSVSIDATGQFLNPVTSIPSTQIHTSHLPSSIRHQHEFSCYEVKQHLSAFRAPVAMRLYRSRVSVLTPSPAGLQIECTQRAGGVCTLGCSLSHLFMGSLRHVADCLGLLARLIKVLRKFSYLQ